MNSVNNNSSEISPDALKQIIRQAYDTSQAPDETRIRLIRHRLMSNLPAKQCTQPKKNRLFSVWIFGFAFVAFGAAASWWYADILWPRQRVVVNEHVHTENDQGRHAATSSEQPGHQKGTDNTRKGDIGDSGRAADENIIYRREPL